jgi:hypothetical protein
MKHEQGFKPDGGLGGAATGRSNANVGQSARGVQIGIPRLRFSSRPVSQPCTAHRSWMPSVQWKPKDRKRTTREDL